MFLNTVFLPTISQLHGSQIWKTSDTATWTQVTSNGFGDTNIINFEAFTGFAGSLYVSGSKGASSTPEGLGGAKIYRLQVPVTTTTTTAPVTYHDNGSSSHHYHCSIDDYYDGRPNAYRTEFLRGKGSLARNYSRHGKPNQRLTMPGLISTGQKQKMENT